MSSSISAHRGCERWVRIPADRCQQSKPTNETRNEASRRRCIDADCFVRCRHSRSAPPIDELAGSRGAIPKPVRQDHQACRQSALKQSSADAEGRRAGRPRFSDWPNCAGVLPNQVRDWLGHRNITTTSRYLATPSVHLQDALHKFEAGRSIRTPFAQTGPTGDGESTTDAPELVASCLSELN